MRPNKIDFYQLYAKYICPIFINEAHLSRVMRKLDFRLCKKQAQNSCAINALLIWAFVIATGIVNVLLYLYPKFQDSSFLLSLHRPLCVRPGWKLRRPVFSCHGSFLSYPNALYEATSSSPFSLWATRDARDK